jgi:acetolactate synthase-1/3 small subunit
MTTRTLSVLVQNRPGVLARISGLFARRHFNINSLAVGPTEDPAVSRITVVVAVDGKPLETVVKQLHKLINVLRVVELPEGSVERELVLIKVKAAPRQRTEVMQIADVFRATVVDVDHESLVVEATGTSDKVASLEAMLRPYGISEVARTGRIALARGAASLKPPCPPAVPLDHRTAS